MKTTVTKQFRFEAAHSLPNHDGKCKNIHGHSYLLEVTVSGTKHTSGPKEGMIVDFNDVSKIVEENIINKWDHHFLNEILPFVTTVENLAEECFKILESKELQIESIKLWETSKAYAEVTK